ncbi:MAG: LysM peptidoglycan-binding domain-containing protein [Ignavibacteriae bacterium]|nr:MAG: LysM peptidoglycan-binding domain-containing protein [Ignavibacteriota bacterium]
MKNLFLIAIFCGGLLVPAMAQDRVPPPPESKPDKELECDEADARILKYKEQNATLQTKLDGLKSDIMKAEGDLTSAVGDLKKCNEDIYSMIGATEADVNSFRERLGRIEGKVREMQRLNDDQLADRQAEVKALEEELNALRRERVAALPEFYDRVIALARDIKGLYREKKIKGYTVGTWAENRDCLWNISGRAEIYGDPFQWPKIWQANTDQIKNPDVIQPGWVLTIPPAGPKTDEEMKAERKYWRKKRAAAEAAAAAATTPAPATPATNNATKTEAGN